MTDNPPTQAIIYSRTASAIQSSSNAPDSHLQQEERCKAYAKQKSYQVVKIFQDIAISGNASDRPGFISMFTFLEEEQADSAVVVIIDHLSVLARNMQTYWELKGKIEKPGGKLESVDGIIEETSDSKFLQNCITLKSEYEDAHS